MAMISVSRPLSLESDGAEMKYGPVQVEDCGEIRVADLLKILKDHTPDCNLASDNNTPEYNLLSDNCWKYADSTFKKLIRMYLEQPDISPEKKTYLEAFLNTPPPVMPATVIGRCGVVGTVEGVVVSVQMVAAASAAAAASGFVSLVVTNTPHVYVALRAAGYSVSVASMQNGMNAGLLFLDKAPLVLAALNPHLANAAVATSGGVAKCGVIAMCLSPVIQPLMIAVAVVGGIYLIHWFVMEATPLGGWIRKRLRSFWFSRRTGPKRPLLEQAAALPPM